MKKTAIMFIDEDTIKIVVGQTLKCIKLQEVDLDYNTRFLDRLFAEAGIFIVSDAVEMTSESFKEYVAGLKGQAPTETSQEAEQPVAAKKTQTKQSSRNGSLYRSTVETYIIVDDLPVGDNIRGTESKRHLSIPPNKAINLGILDPEAVRNSSILRGLINDGTLVPCSPQEAAELDRQANDVIQQEREEAYTDQFAPLLPEGVSAADFASQSSRTVNMNDLHDAPVVEVGAENEPAFDPSRPLTMDQMLKLTGATDEAPPPEYVAPRPRRQLAARPAVQKTGIKPKQGIIRF